MINLVIIMINTDFSVLQGQESPKRQISGPVCEGVSRLGKLKCEESANGGCSYS